MSRNGPSALAVRPVNRVAPGAFAVSGKFGPVFRSGRQDPAGIVRLLVTFRWRPFLTYFFSGVAVGAVTGGRVAESLGASFGSFSC